MFKTARCVSVWESRTGCIVDSGMVCIEWRTVCSGVSYFSEADMVGEGELG